jgi:hypothetical protein
VAPSRVGDPRPRLMAVTLWASQEVPDAQNPAYRRASHFFLRQRLSMSAFRDGYLEWLSRLPA